MAYDNTDIATPDPIDVHVGAEIRTRRKALGISQEKLGEQCSVTFQQVQKYERGANRVSASMLSRMARALACSPGDFFPASDHEPAANPVHAQAMTLAGLDHGAQLLTDLVQVGRTNSQAYRSMVNLARALADD